MNRLGILAMGDFAGFMGSAAIAFTLFVDYTGEAFTGLAWGMIALTFLFFLSMLHEIINAYK